MLIADKRIIDEIDSWNKYTVLNEDTGEESLLSDTPEPIKERYIKFKELLDKASMISSEEFENALDAIFDTSDN